MLYISHYLYRDNADRLTFRLILPTLLQQRFPSVGREIRWSLDGVPLDDARELALDLARRIRDLRFRLGDLKTAEGLLQELQRIQASIPPLSRQAEPRTAVHAHSSQVACPVHDLSLALGRQRVEQLRLMPTFLLREPQQLTLQVPLPDLLGVACR